MSRLIIVSNRLPVTLSTQGGAVTVTPSAGGLATGLRGPFERSGGLWIGWPGELPKLDSAARAEVARQLADLRTVPIELGPDELRRYYDGFANGVLWPVFHYLLDAIPLHSADWEVYQKVNARFADAVVANYRPGDVIWVQDYHLLLLPGLLRERLPDARIGFFLHIPFPASEVFRMLPWRAQLLSGVLGADLVGFHTPSYARNFASSLVRMLGLEPRLDEVTVAGRRVRFGAFPMGIDTASFAGPAAPPEGLDRRADEHVLLAVDRLDYTKGIRRRMLAVERVLHRRPELRGKLKLIQIAVPSREKVDAYRSFRRRVEELVGAINGRCSTLGGAPIHYLYRGFPQEQLVALYRAASAMLVTPLRDGMNLVAKEFAAARVDGDGVLVLSEFAGAAEELPEALQVNPYDVDGLATAIEQALDMPEAERRARMGALRARVTGSDVFRWADGFLAELAACEPPAAPDELPAPSVEHVRAAARSARRLVLALDYDGTLAPLAPRPELAAPDAELRALLAALAARPELAVHVVSGRPREDLERWFGALPIGLHAEHGGASRTGGVWHTRARVAEELGEKLHATLARAAAYTPGALVERKGSGFAWHYRQAEPESGAHQARELRLHLRELLSDTPFEVLVGHKVVEVRPRGIHKGVALQGLLEPGDIVLAIGDDRTDEDLFAAVPSGSLTIRVGPGPTGARFRVPDVAAARALLRALADAP